jgi:ubiquinone/menaquinone biosynthesis C-methylase UbiE
MSNQNETTRLREQYTRVYLPDSHDRSYPWHPRNPVSLYYRQAQEREMISALNALDIQLEGMHILDIGCGGGGLLRFLASLGSLPENLLGIDLVPERVAVARKMSPPLVGLTVANATGLPCRSHYFDLVSQFTVFSSLLAPEYREAVAGEMMRVVKPGGLILWYDLQMGESNTTRGISPGEIQYLFPGFDILLLKFLHIRYTYRLAQISSALASLAEFLPLAKTHLLVILKDTSGDKE